MQLRYRINDEMFTWSSMALVMALLEGSVIGVLIKNGFDGQVETWLLNLSVALATGAPYFSNLLSVFWVKLSHGRSKAELVSNLAVICCLTAFGISFVKFDPQGLLILLLLYVSSRISWSGILTIRSTIWRSNYPRHIRGKVAARLATMASLLMSVTALLVGWLMDWHFKSFQWVYIGFALITLMGAYRYRFLSVRHQVKHIGREKSETRQPGISRMFAILNENKPFGKYMLAMFLLGSGNLMFMAPLIVYINEHTQLMKSSQIVITTVIPLGLIPLAVGWWARLLDGNHIFHFRSLHGWVFVASVMVFLAACVLQINYLFYVGAALYGFALSGGVIGWNLGHNDFVGNANPMEYMAVHVTLTGIRGLLMPLIGVGFYQWLQSIDGELSQYALLLPLSLTMIGASLFVWYNRQRLAGKLNS